jgi:hypothetical protein
MLLELALHELQFIRQPEMPIAMSKRTHVSNAIHLMERDEGYQGNS